MTRTALTLKNCRLCGSKKLKTVIDLGISPPPNTLLKKSQFKKEQFFPLKVNFCLNCGQVQLSHVVSPNLMFQNYPYVSSTSQVMIDHFNDYAASVTKKLKLKKGNLVVEMGSNDGILLKFFKSHGLKVLGVDPAKNIAAIANKNGVPTLPNFFTTQIATKIVKKYGQAKLIAANNVFAHIHDLNEVIKGVDILLDENGVFVIEFPYINNLIEDNVFDSIYHEHLSYLAVGPLKKFSEKYQMQIFDVVSNSVQGGSIRIFIEKANGPFKVSKSIFKYLELEKKKKLNKYQTFIKFSQKIKNTKKSLMLILHKLKKQNNKIIGYGAPGRSTTLLNYFGINNKILDFIVDDNPLKHGLFTPGSHILVLPINNIELSKPDYILILSWNYAKPIMKKLVNFKKAGGSFIIPIPTPKVI